MNGFIEVKTPEGSRRLLKTDEILQVDELPGQGALIHMDSWAGDGLPVSTTYDEVLTAISRSQDG